MAEKTDNVVLEMLRQIRASQDRVEADIVDLKVRVSAIEHHLGQVQIQIAALNQRMDRFDERLARVERRLDLVETH